MLIRFHEIKKNCISSLLIAVEGNDFMKLEPKKMIRTGELGLLYLKAGMVVLSFLRPRVFGHNKIQNKQRAKREKMKHQCRGNFSFAKKHIYKRGKLGLRAYKLIKDRYF